MFVINAFTAPMKIINIASIWCVLGSAGHLQPNQRG